jgi:superfamily II DNA or RNA helicase
LRLYAAFGTAFELATTKRLIKNKTLATLDVRPIRFTYDPPMPKRLDYLSEIDWLVAHPERNRAIAQLVASLTDKRVLVFYQLIEKHGNRLVPIIEKACPGRPVKFVHGDVSKEDRDAIREVMRAHTNAVIVYSWGTGSTGLDIPELDAVIFASPTKSSIRILQSIGRLLRRTLTKTHATVYDLIDDGQLPKQKHNYAYRHALLRHSLYNRKGFNVKPELSILLSRKTP